MRKQVLKQLIDAYTPSGFEGPGVKIFDTEMEALGARRYYSDKIGNSAWAVGDGPVKVLISGHVDEISARIQHVSDDGILSIVNVGGMDRKALLGSEVIILGSKGPIRGVIGKKPIHLEYKDDDEKDTIGKFCSLRVDIGAESKSDVEEIGINPGCPLVHSRCVDLEFGKYKLRGNALDDKLGVFTTIEIIRALQEEGFDREKYTIIGMTTVQEETGTRGALIAAHNINPDVSIDFDVCPSTDGNLEIDKDEHGDIRLGGGAVINWGPEKSARLCQEMNKVAQEKGIKVQNYTASAGGTNTDVLQLFSRDCETGLISFPNRYMHTPVECCDWRDVEETIKLIKEIIQDGTVI